jgi:hypothetical protein
MVYSHHKAQNKEKTMINAQMSAFQNCWKQSDVWHQTKASRGTIVSICFPVGPVHRQGTFSEHSTHDVFALEKSLGFQSIPQLRIRDIELCVCVSWLPVFEGCF